MENNPDLFEEPADKKPNSDQPENLNNEEVPDSEQPIATENSASEEDSLEETDWEETDFPVEELEEVPAIEEPIETATIPEKVAFRYLISFEGVDNDFFFIAFRGYFLTVLTLGLYYPWAKVQRMRYILNNLWLDGSPFVFEAKGEEVFKGFIKVYAILLLLAGVYVYALFSKNGIIQFFGPLSFSIFSFIIAPLAIHGSMKYRSGKTSWKGIYFNYSGKLEDLYGLFLKNIILLIVTFGIYGLWARVNIMEYLARNLRLGNMEFKYKGRGGDLFGRSILTVLAGIGLFYLVMAIVFIAFAAFGLLDGTSNGSIFEKPARFFFLIFGIIVANVIVVFPAFLNLQVWTFKYNLTKTLFRLGNEVGHVETQINVRKLMWFEWRNALIVLFTLGVGLPFVIVRRMKKYSQLISFVGAIDLESVVQTGQEYHNAFGEDLGDQFDIDII